MQEVYTKEETQSFKVGAYVALAILAIIGYKAFTAQEIEHADNGSYYALDARFGRTEKQTADNAGQQPETDNAGNGNNRNQLGSPQRFNLLQFAFGTALFLF